MLLVERRGRVLERDELIRELWPDTIVEEANVTFQVSTVRKALGEDGSKWIETVPKHGYRFTAPVREVRPENTRDGEALSMPPAAGARLGAPMWGRTGTGLALVAVVATFVAFWYASRPDAPVPSEIRLEAVPLTSYTGCEAEPTFSPDGSHVAFTWDGENQDNHDIYVKAIGAEQPLQLTSDRARDGSPAWSPDGTRIAFLRDKPGGGSEVRLIPPTGGAEHTIGEVQGLAHHGLSWSPDGRSLAVVDRSSPGERLGIFVLDVVSGVKTKLTSPSILATCCRPSRPTVGPSPSPGTLMARPFGAFVHVVPVAGGEPREARANQRPEEGSTGLDCRREGDSLRRGASRTGRRSAQAIVVRKSQYLLVESPCRRRAGPPSGRERGGGRRGRVAGRTSPRLFAGDDRLGHLAARSAAGASDGRSTDPIRPVHRGRRQSTVFPRWRASGVHLGSERPDRDLGRRRARQAPAPADLSRKGGIRRLPAVVPRRKDDRVRLCRESWHQRGHLRDQRFGRHAAAGDDVSRDRRDAELVERRALHLLRVEPERLRCRCGRCRRAGRKPGNARQVTRGGGFAAIESTDGRRVLHEENVGHAGSAERPLEDPGRGR